MAKLKGPVMLTILDGFGIGDGQDPTNAVVQANPRTFLELWISALTLYWMHLVWP